MECKLCLKPEEDSFEVDSREGVQQNARLILRQHFKFCFSEDEDKKSDRACRSCWTCVEAYHRFYIYVENQHRNFLSIQDNKTISIQPMDESIFIEEPLLVPKSEKDDEETEEVLDSDEDWLPDKFDDGNSDVNSVIPDKETPSEINLENSKTTERRTKQTKRKIPCLECGDYFSSLNKLHRHIRNVHDVFPLKCKEPQCKKRFATSYELDKHMRYMHADAKCPICSKEVRERYMETHIKLNHTTQTQVICDLCGKVSSCLSKQKLHYKNQHTIQPSIQCDACKKWFKNKTSFQLHYRNYHKHKIDPIKCDICGWFSPNPKAHRAHKGRHVEGYNNKFKCIDCGKGFCSKLKLQEHSYIHSGITDAYKCQHCDKTFRFGSSLSLHKKKCPVESS